MQKIKIIIKIEYSDSNKTPLITLSHMVEVNYFFIFR